MGHIAAYAPIATVKEKRMPIRAIRKVPKDWKHPKYKSGGYVPLFDGWLEDLAYYGEEAQEDDHYPDKGEYMMPDLPLDSPKRTHFMMYEVGSVHIRNVPLSPAIETLKELSEWLYGGDGERVMMCPACCNSGLQLKNDGRVVNCSACNASGGIGVDVHFTDDELDQKVSAKQLEDFGKVFCTLNGIYARNGKSWQMGEYWTWETVTIIKLGFGKDKGLVFQRIKGLNYTIIGLIEDMVAHGRDYDIDFSKGEHRIYKHIDGYDCVILMKPSNAKYWLTNRAVSDKTRTFRDLKEAGR